MSKVSGKRFRRQRGTIPAQRCSCSCSVLMLMIMVTVMQPAHACFVLLQHQSPRTTTEYGVRLIWIERCFQQGSATAHRKYLNGPHQDTPGIPRIEVRYTEVPCLMAALIVKMWTQNGPAYRTQDSERLDALVTLIRADSYRRSLGREPRNMYFIPGGPFAASY